MLQYRMTAVSDAEAALIETIRDVQYGEIYGAEVEDQPPDARIELTEKEKCLIDLIRGGSQYLSVITVHGGEPAYAEDDKKVNGFSCRIKYKFPTVPTEG
jgi:hypothetical protein